jgi:large subunit ribosomal protein L23
MKIIIRKPLLTEKATLASEKGIYSFEVDAEANKIQIAEAVEKQFNVKVDEVRTMWMPLRSRSQFTRRGVVRGAKSRRKKAVVSLQPGFTIDVFTPMDVKAE